MNSMPPLGASISMPWLAALVPLVAGSKPQRAKQLQRRLKVIQRFAEHAREDDGANHVNSVSSFQFPSFKRENPELQNCDALAYSKLETNSDN